MSCRIRQCRCAVAANSIPCEDMCTHIQPLREQRYACIGSHASATGLCRKGAKRRSSGRLWRASRCRSVRKDTITEEASNAKDLEVPPGRLVGCLGKEIGRIVVAVVRGRIV